MWKQAHFELEERDYQLLFFFLCFLCLFFICRCYFSCCFSFSSYSSATFVAALSLQTHLKWELPHLKFVIFQWQDLMIVVPHWFDLHTLLCVFHKVDSMYIHYFLRLIVVVRLNEKNAKRNKKSKKYKVRQKDKHWKYSIKPSSMNFQQSYNMIIVGENSNFNVG